jgi:hypothetical protein
MAHFTQAAAAEVQALQVQVVQVEMVAAALVEMEQLAFQAQLTLAAAVVGAEQQEAALAVLALLSYVTQAHNVERAEQLHLSMVTHITPLPHQAHLQHKE